MIQGEEKGGGEMRSNVWMHTCGMDIMGGVLDWKRGMGHHFPDYGLSVG